MKFRDISTVNAEREAGPLRHIMATSPRGACLPWWRWAGLYERRDTRAADLVYARMLGWPGY